MLIIFVFLCEVNNAIERVKKRSYNKKYYFENKDIIFTRKKEAYYEDLDKSHEESAAHSKTNYDKNPDSGAKSTARSKVNYDREPDSGTKSTARSKANRALLNLLFFLVR